MDQAQFLGLVLFGFVVATLLFLRVRGRSRKRILLTDYRAGVHFVGGSLKELLGPGSYTFDSRKEQITVVDLRPQPILIERLAFQNALRQEGVISIGTELVVRDPRLSSTMLREEVKDAYMITRDAIRNAMSKQIATSPEDSSSLQRELTQAANADLARVGFAVTEIEITELSSQFQNTPLSGAAQVIQ